MQLNSHPCPECHGAKVLDCDDCDCPYCPGEHECQVCSGTGLDPGKIDFKRYLVAEHELQAEKRMIYELVEDGVGVGRTNGTRSIRYADFELAKLSEMRGILQ